jgi:integrase
VSKKLGQRILGPYKLTRDRWQVVEMDAHGGRSSVVFATEDKATRYIEMMRAELSREDHTTESALVEYKSHLADKGDKSASIEVTAWAIELFFPDATPLRSLTAKRCAALYEDLRTRPSKRTGEPLAVDSHRNILAQTKSYLAWCVSRGWIAANPLADVKGIGKRRPRGKSLGKAGNELRVAQSRTWYRKALELAHAGDEGAVAALVALLLGCRASEIVSRRVADLDEDQAPGDLLWIPDSKTAAGRRQIEVPPVLRPLLVRCSAGKLPTRHLFECSRPHEQATPKPHTRDWIIDQVRRICDLAGVPQITAHALRGQLATITATRGLAGHLIAETLGHEDERTTMHSYAAPGSAAAGARRRGWDVLDGGATPAEKGSK